MEYTLVGEKGLAPTTLHGEYGNTSETRSRTPAFSDHEGAWRPVPRWGEFLINLGRLWPSAATANARRISLVSMPCDSAGAGLVALGTLIRDLGDPAANDVEMHYAALHRFAQQFVRSCRDCSVRCDPVARQCGYFSEASGVLKHINGRRYGILDIPDSLAWGSGFQCSNKREVRYVLAHSATSWTIDGQPPVQLHADGSPLDGRLYQQFAGDTKVQSNNLRNTFSGLCIAGRALGEAATRDAYASIRFRIDDVEASLPELLTVHSWSASTAVSRTTFFNARTGQFDRFSYAPGLVVADGGISFLKVLKAREFERSDVIGVVPRTLDRAMLERIGNRLVNLSQWYVEDNELRAKFGNVPRGITVSFLHQKTT